LDQSQLLGLSQRVLVVALAGLFLATSACGTRQHRPIGRRVIVSFPNFSHYSIRLQLLLKGLAPKNDQLPYSWYDTPNIRVITLADFRLFARDVGYRIVREIAINTNTTNSSGTIVRYLTNCRATYGIFIIEKKSAEGE